MTSRRRITVWLTLGVLLTLGLGAAIIGHRVRRNLAFEVAVRSARGSVYWRYTIPSWTRWLSAKQAKRVECALALVSNAATIQCHPEPLKKRRFGNAEWNQLLNVIRSGPPVVAILAQGTDVGDCSVEQLTELPQLEALALQGTHVTDEGLKSVGRLTGLQVLHLSRTSITDAGLAQLSSLSNLRALNLDHTSITAEGLQHLSKLTQLEDLSVVNTGLTEDALQSLQAQLPSLMISDD